MGPIAPMIRRLVAVVLIAIAIGFLQPKEPQSAIAAVLIITGLNIWTWRQYP